MSEIRSVSVHLDADVAGYIAKMRLAGAATDQAFSRASTNIGSTNTALGSTEQKIKDVDRAATGLDRTFQKVSGSNGLTKVAQGLDKFTSGLGLIPALAIPAAAALIPLTAAVGGLVAALAAPIAFSAGGVGLFAFLGSFAIKSTQQQYKNIDTLQKHLATLTKGSKDYVATQKAIQAAEKSLSPQQRQFHNELQTLEGDFRGFIAGPAGQDLLGPFTEGMKVADSLLPKVTPIIHSVSDSLSTLLGQLASYTQSRGFETFVHRMAAQVGPDLMVFGHLAGDAAVGIQQLLLILGHRLSPELLNELQRLGQGFANWAQSKGARQDVESFIQYLHEVGPDVATTVAALARSAAHLVEALAPLGPPTLHVITGIADAFNSIDPHILTLLAGSFVGLAAFGKLGGFKVLGGASQALGAIRGGGGVASVTGKLGVQDVFVVNMPGGGIPGVGGTGAPGAPGVPGGAAKGAGFLNTAALAVTTYAITSAVDAAIHKAVESALGKQAADLNSKVGHTLLGLPTPGTNTSVLPVSWSNAIAGAIKDGFHEVASSDHGHVTGTTNRATVETGAPGATFDRTSASLDKVSTRFQALQQHAADASRQIDLAGHSAQRFGDTGGAAAQRVADNLNSVKAGPASAAFDAVGHSAAANSQRATGSIDDIQHHVDSLHGKNVDVNVNGGQSLATLREISALEASLRSKTITVTTLRTTGGRSTAGNAAGGYISGPGGPTSDSILARLSNGEYVMRAAAVSHYGISMMNRLNAKAFASGGPVSASSSNNGIIPGSPAANALKHEQGQEKQRLHELNKELADATKNLQKEQQQRQNLISQEQQLAATVTAGFRSQFLGTQAIWGAAASPLSIINQDIRNIRQYRTDIRELRRRGASGALLSNVTTLADAQQLIGDSPAALRLLSQRYALRQRLSRAAGDQLGDYRFQKAINEQTKELKHTREHIKDIQHELHHHSAQLAQIDHSIQNEGPKATGKAVNQGVQHATRRAR